MSWLRRGPVVEARCPPLRYALSTDGLAFKPTPMGLVVLRDRLKGRGQKLTRADIDSWLAE